METGHETPSDTNVSEELPNLFIDEQTCKGCSYSCTIQDLHLHLGSADFARCKKYYSTTEMDKIMTAYMRFRKKIKLSRFVTYLDVTFNENNSHRYFFTITGNLMKLENFQCLLRNKHVKAVVAAALYKICTFILVLVNLQDVKKNIPNWNWIKY